MLARGNKYLWAPACGRVAFVRWSWAIFGALAVYCLWASSLILQNPVDGAFYSHLYTREDVGTQHYHGMLLSLQRRGANGTIGANYTWSHCIGINPGANSTGNGTVNYIDPNNRSFDYGNCADIGGADRRHVFNLTGVVPSPQFNGLTGKLASGAMAVTEATVQVMIK